MFLKIKGSVQKISEEQIEEIIFEHFSYITDKYKRDKKIIFSKSSENKLMNAGVYCINSDILLRLNKTFVSIENEFINKLINKKKLYKLQLMLNEFV